MRAPGLLPRRLLAAVRAWFDSESVPPQGAREGDDRVDWLRVTPFLALHAGCLGVLVVGWSPTALAVAAGLYAVRMLAITAFYHRYFSHRAFATSRAAQLVFAVLGASAAQRGPLWWAAHHRDHHRHADDPADVHSPHQHGLLWSHCGWFLSRANYATRSEQVKDLARYPELRWLDRFDGVVPALLAALLYAVGELLAARAPALGTDGPQLLVWGFLVSTVALYHATFAINSLAHLVGRRPWATGDRSGNSLALALLTFGEGWHNNHHRFPGAARQGIGPWQVDPTHAVLRLLAALGVVWDLVPHPPAARGSPERSP